MCAKNFARQTSRLFSGGFYAYFVRLHILRQSVHMLETEPNK